jgi:hypothetical protein
MAGAGSRQQAAAASASVTSAAAIASPPEIVLQQQQQQSQQQQQQQQHVAPDYTSVAIEKLLHSIWDTKVNDIMAAINHLGLV